MRIDLSDDELGLLIDILKEKSADLRVQTRRAETGEYHEELRGLERTVVDVLRKLEGARSTETHAEAR